MPNEVQMARMLLTMKTDRRGQMALPDSRTNPDLVARFLLKPGRRYEEAVKAFEPYNKAGAALIQEGTAASNRKTFIYVNNRLEGNALATIEAMLSSDG